MRARAFATVWLAAALVAVAAHPSPARALIPVTLTVVASPSTVYVGEPITITGTVTPNPGACPILLAGENLTLDPATGSATTTYVRQSATTGTQFPGLFLGCGDYASTSYVYSNWVTVIQRTTAISLSSPATVGRGDPFNVSVSLSPAPPSGTVRIREVGATGIDGILNRVVGTAAVSGSSPVTVELPSMLPGSYVLQAEFLGSDLYADAISTQKTITVFDRPTTTSITVGPDPSFWGQPIRVDVTVSPIPDDGGGVQILLNGLHAAWATMNWNNGKGSATFTPNLPGSHTVSAVFGGSAYPISRYAPSRDDETHTVSSTPVDDDPPVGTVSVNGGANLVTDGGVTLTFTVSDASPVVALEVSNDGSTWEGIGVVESKYWSLGAAGGSNAEGHRTVHARWTDQWNNVGTATDSFTFDWTGPTGVVIIDASGNYTFDTTVDLSVSATDAGSGVSRVAASNDGSTWTERSYTPSYQWTLTPGNGVKTVHVKWRDGNGHWSAVKTDTIVLDTVAPSATAPGRAFVSGGTLSSTSVPTKFTWSGSDTTSGVARYEAALSTDGGSYTTLSTSLATSTLTRSLAPAHSYRLRVRAVDKAGNVGAWAYGATFTVSAYQENSSRITYSGTWTRVSGSGYWGGYEKYAKAAGARATFTFTGRTFAWIGCVGPTRGSAKVYVNGVLTKTVSLYTSGAACKRVVLAMSWSTSTSRQIRIVVSGTAGHPRVGIDALVMGT